MQPTSNHRIDIYVNGSPIDVGDQGNLNLRINKVLFDPTKTTTKQAEYSYSFSIPQTENNDKVFNFANNLSKTNKYHARYKCEVYSDGQLLFDASLTLEGYNAREKEYDCHLVNIKVSSLEDIFGDAVMTDIPWMIDFDGASTINEVNRDLSTDYFFPFVCYGAFQKTPSKEDDIADEYTSKFDIDKYNKFWVESFYPSMKVLGLVKKALEWKGYQVVGNAYSDKILNNVYASCNLAQGQSPDYNVGNPKFGKISLHSDFSNSGRYYERMNIQDLSFPYYKVRQRDFRLTSDGNLSEYNFATIDWWNLLDSRSATVTINNDNYMFDPGEQVIVIPKSGWYRIGMKAIVVLNDPNKTFSATQWYCSLSGPDAQLEEKSITLKKDLMFITPVEVQLIRNYDDNIELIKGNTNIEWATGDPNQETYTYGYWRQYVGNTFPEWVENTYPNRTIWTTEFPHQDLIGTKSPTELNDLTIITQPRRGIGNPPPSSSDSKTVIEGYITPIGSPISYDPAVSEGFIMGLSSFGGVKTAIIKNGYSWSNASSIENKVMANVSGLTAVMVNGSKKPTNYGANTYPNAPANRYTSFDKEIGRGFSGETYCLVWLEKNDRVEPVVIQRDFGDTQKYDVDVTLDLTIEAFSDRSNYQLRADNIGYNSPIEFPSQLNLCNFTNQETKVSDWINNVLTAFNLELSIEGNIATIDINKSIRNSNITYAVDLNDRVSPYECESQYIDYPKELSVKYQINTEEWGFEQSVPEDKIDLDDWEKYGDSGYTVIQLNDDTYETSTQSTQTSFSYTWYDTFNWYYVNSSGTQSSTPSQIRLPVIELSQYMADGYGYEDAMQHDGYSLTQRFWFRQGQYLRGIYLADHMHELVELTIPTNQWAGVNLSYKDSETSILTNYFDAVPMLSSNYVNIEVYINPDEYNSISNGAMVHMDSDLYYVAEIDGYDPTGTNPTGLKLVKKV